MSFVYRCLAVSDPNKPIRTRCKNSPDKNGIICSNHLVEAKTKPIHILMHHEVTKQFGVKFNNQITVKIDMVSKANKAPIPKSTIDEKVRSTKTKLIEQLGSLTIDGIKDFHNKMGLNIWENTVKGRNEYAVKFFIAKAIVDKIYSEQLGK